MASHKSPLRDRLLSNSPDPLKSEILRESGMGWSPASTPAAAPANTDAMTSPLRIAKREPSVRPKGPVVARRTSSSYRHVHTNNLVSKSPFKSQIPTPSTPSSRPAPIPLPTRRVSGEKRPRPSSMHEQAETENDRPFALKRERKQSRTFQELIQKEPVTKSPFKSLQPIPLESEPPPPPPLISFNDTNRQRSTSPGNFRMHVSAAPNVNLSPARSALVSRRMHGPRLSGGPRRPRRKVTFYERCDVLEFDREEEPEEEEEVGFESCEDEDRDVADDPFVNQGLEHVEPDELIEEDVSCRSIQLGDTALDSTLPSLLSDPDTSITGIVDEIFANTHPTNSLPEDSITTPLRQHDIPTDLETEDGVPFGRSHHIERFLHHPSTLTHPFFPHGSPQSHHSASGHPFNMGLPTRASPLGPPSTPPRRSPIVAHRTPPLGRSTHLERVRMAREHEREEEGELEHVNKLPASPSPMKKLPAIPATREDGLIPSFILKGSNLPESNSNLSTMMKVDTFAPRLQDEPVLPELEKLNNSNASFDSMEPANLSLGNSEVNLSGLVDAISQETRGSREPKRPFPSVERSRPESPSLLAVHGTSCRFSSPASHSASPLLAVKNEEQGIANSPSRERISREEVQRRLMNQRLSSSSPAPELASSTGSLHPAAPIEEIQPPTPRLSTEINIDKEKDGMSVLTTQTDFSTETAIVETVEKRILGLATLAPQTVVDKEFGLLGARPQLDMDFGSKFSLGGFGATTFDTETKGVDSRDNLGPNKKAAPHPGIHDSNTSGIKMGDVDVDMEMKSALDRLMEDVASAGGRADNSMTTEEYDESFDRSQSMTREDSPLPASAHPKVLERAATDSVLLHHNEASGIASRTVSGASTVTEPPPVPPKDNIVMREQLILQKRRQTRGKANDDDDDIISRRSRDRQGLGYGRPSRRRSMSTGDAEALGGGAQKRGEALLDIVSEDNHNNDLLADSIEKELQKLARAPSNVRKSKYNVRQRGGTIYASSSDEKVSHMAGAGDLDAGRAWRMVRRPSDMNEYSKQIKEYRSQDKGKAYGKVFVRVLGIKGLHLPLPLEQTVITCTLNNGIHFVTTPECNLSRECRINQEFELIEHSKLEFTLTFRVRRDTHIIAQYKTLSPSAPAPLPLPPPLPPAMAPSKSYGMRSFFSSSPKKTSKEKMVAQPPPPPQPQHLRLPENLARYLKPDGTLARAFVSFKDVSSRCDTRLFETSYPLIGQRVEIGGKYSTLEVGEVVLQLFRLPPLPGLPQDQLPQSLDECHRGLRHLNWHKATYFQGTLTQNGGDCNSWRRRQLRVIGSNLVAFNDVTKRATATIDLKKAIAVEDNEKSQLSADEYDGAYGVERSFRLTFPQHQEIIFFADTDEEKTKWLEVLRALVGHIPPHPLWAELLWQRQEEIAKRMQAAQQTIPQQQPSRQR